MGHKKRVDIPMHGHRLTFPFRRVYRVLHFHITARRVPNSASSLGVSYEAQLNPHSAADYRSVRSQA